MTSVLSEKSAAKTAITRKIIDGTAIFAKSRKKSRTFKLNTHGINADAFILCAFNYFPPLL